MTPEEKQRSIYIVSANGEIEFPIESFTIKGVLPFPGSMDVPSMTIIPNILDFTIMPFGIDISLTSTKFESKHPHFLAKVANGVPCI